MSHYIYGKNPVLEWLKSNMEISKIVILQQAGGEPIRHIEKLAEEKSIPVERIKKAEFVKKIKGRVHQGVAAFIDIPPYASIEEILENARRKGEPLLLAILDGIQDPHNLGAVLRSADGAGVHGIIIPKDHAVELTPAVFKASAGAAAHVPVVRITNLARTIDELKDYGIWFVGTDRDGPQMHTEIDLTGPVGIVLGSEGRGLRRLVRGKCDFIATIPMAGRLDSLNVSVAAALMFFEARRQRGFNL